MGEEIKDNCGIALAHTLHDTYSFIKSLQHRGREAFGRPLLLRRRLRQRTGSQGREALSQ